MIGDGTNFVSSTPTFPTTAGTSGNVLTSNGTNWTSTAPAAAGLGYTMQMTTFSSQNPLTDASTYFFRMSASLDAGTASGTSGARIYFPQAGTITKCYGAFLILGTLATSENVTLNIRLNNTTDTAVSSTIQLTSIITSFNNAALSIAVAAGDYIEYKMVNPTWATNPSTISCSVTLYVT